MSDSKSSRAKKKKKRARAKNSSPQNMAPVQASPADQVLSAPETVETAANSETAATPETVEPAVPLEKTPDGPHGSPLVVAPEGAGEKSAGR
ncbi:MAG TPA: hypothetical protein PK671_17100, partial [Candidatus Obscuribacter sp.]|nr:hypothetical protein [Candidatus Obscuribacter sp.]